jgi:hypothetical protein
VCCDAYVVDAEFLRLDALTFEHARYDLLDAVLGVGEPLRDAGEKGREQPPDE